jgi:hypothetical protein
MSLPEPCSKRPLRALQRVDADIWRGVVVVIFALTFMLLGGALVVVGRILG